MSDNNDFGSFLSGFLVGGLVGAAVALLMAPQSGEETRVLIRDKSLELKDKTVTSLEEAYERAEHAAADARVRADELAKLAQQRAEELRQRGQVVLEEQRAKISSAIAQKETDAKDNKPAEKDGKKSAAKKK
jgi:gas vesicle protein